MTAQAGAVAACSECGMPCAATDYHPYAACMMFKACQNSEVVRRNIAAIRGVPVEALEWLVEALRKEAATIAKPYGFVTEHVIGKAEGLESCAERIEQLIKERSNG